MLERELNDEELDLTEGEDEELPDADEESEPDEESEADESADGEESEADADESEDDESDPEDGELVVTIGDEKPEADEDEIPADAAKWAKQVRLQNRQLQKELKALKKQVAAPAQQPKQLGPKPKLADHNYDEAEYEKALDAWHEAKREADKAEREAKDAQAAQEREWQSRLQSHEKAKAALKVKGYDEAEERVFEELDQTQRGIIIGGAANSALLVYALDKNPKALKQLAAIKDPVQYAFAVAKLETKLKTTKRRPATAPESTLAKGNAGAARKGEAVLQKLRDDAEKSGDYTKVNAYRRKLRSAK